MRIVKAFSRGSLMKRLPAEVKEILQEYYPNLNLDEIEIKENTLTGKFFAEFFRAAAVTIGRKIHLTKYSYFSWQKPTREIFLLIHELKHIEQQEKMGTIKFCVKYIFDWVLSGFQDGEDMPLEKPAYQIQREFLANKKRAI